MTYLPYAGLILVALAALGFALGPLWGAPGPKKARLLLGLAIACFLIGVGGGIYWMVGRPYLALRAAQGLNANDMNGLVTPLIARLRAHPDDQQGWIYLAQIYVNANDSVDGAAALARAVALEQAHHRANPALYAAYGETLVTANGGTVTADAEAAFRSALAANPQNSPARYYLGVAAVQRGDKQTAAKFWQQLLGEVPPEAPLHQMLVDRLASIGAAPNTAGGGAPDINAMVSGLAARLAANPDDPAGWLRLIRAYSVLGDTDKAKAALATARKTVGSSALVKSALDSEAQELKLE